MIVSDRERLYYVINNVVCWRSLSTPALKSLRVDGEILEIGIYREGFFLRFEKKIDIYNKDGNLLKSLKTEEGTDYFSTDQYLCSLKRRENTTYDIYLFEDNDFTKIRSFKLSIDEVVFRAYASNGKIILHTNKRIIIFPVRGEGENIKKINGNFKSNLLETERGYYLVTSDDELIFHQHGSEKQMIKKVPYSGDEFYQLEICRNKIIVNNKEEIIIGDKKYPYKVNSLTVWKNRVYYVQDGELRHIDTGNTTVVSKYPQYYSEIVSIPFLQIVAYITDSFLYVEEVDTGITKNVEINGYITGLQPAENYLAVMIGHNKVLYIDPKTPSLERKYEFFRPDDHLTLAKNNGRFILGFVLGNVIYDGFRDVVHMNILQGIDIMNLVYTSDKKIALSTSEGVFTEDYGLIKAFPYGNSVFDMVGSKLIFEGYTPLNRRYEGLTEITINNEEIVISLIEKNQNKFIYFIPGGNLEYILYDGINIYWKGKYIFEGVIDEPSLCVCNQEIYFVSNSEIVKIPLDSREIKSGNYKPYKVYNPQGNFLQPLTESKLLSVGDKAASVINITNGEIVNSVETPSSILSVYIDRDKEQIYLLQSNHKTKYIYDFNLNPIDSFDLNIMYITSSYFVVGRHRYYLIVPRNTEKEPLKIDKDYKLILSSDNVLCFMLPGNNQEVKVVYENEIYSIELREAAKLKIDNNRLTINKRTFNLGSSQDIIYNYNRFKHKLTGEKTSYIHYGDPYHGDSVKVSLGKNELSQWIYTSPSPREINKIIYGDTTLFTMYGDAYLIIDNEIYVNDIFLLEKELDDLYKAELLDNSFQAKMVLGILIENKKRDLLEYKA